MAASASSASAAAAATSAGTSSGRVVVIDPPQCSVCTLAYECDEPKSNAESHLPRTLPCTHSLCSACLLQLIKATPGSDTNAATAAVRQREWDSVVSLVDLRTVCVSLAISAGRRVKCPTCRDERAIHLSPRTSAVYMSPGEWVRLIPQSADIIQSIRRSRHLEAALQQERMLRLQNVARCACDLSCADAAAVWCAECDGDLCAKHDAAMHRADSFAAHRRIPLAEKAAASQAKMMMALMTARAAATRERLKKAKMSAALASGFASSDLSPQPRESSVSRSFISSRSSSSLSSRSRSAGLLRSLTPDQLCDLARFLDDVPLVSSHQRAHFAIVLGSAASLQLPLAEDRFPLRVHLLIGRPISSLCAPRVHRTARDCCTAPPATDSRRATSGADIDIHARAKRPLSHSSRSPHQLRATAATARNALVCG